MIRKKIAKAGERIGALVGLAVTLTGLGLVLSGCETLKDERNPIWTDYRERHPIALVEKDRKLEVFVGSARGLTPAQRAEVAAFARSWRGEGTGHFIIERPTGARNAAAEAAALGEIRAILIAAGASPGSIRVVPYRIPERGMLAVITINYPRLAAEVGGCGEWPDDLGASADKKQFENVEYWNFGCSVQRNLAAMVANPADLVQPQAEAPTYAARRSTVLDKYRKGESPATVYPDASKGAISDLGK